MAKFKSSSPDFIQQAFSPMIAVLQSPTVEEICKKNNLNFIQLVKPFSKAIVDCILRDPSSNGPIPIRTLRISFCDIHSRPPPPQIARSYFNKSVSYNAIYKMVKFGIGNDENIEIPEVTPWFDAWRDTFFQVQYPSDHEFTKHFIGSLVIITSLDTSPLERLAELVDSLQSQMSSAPNKLPKWFSSTSQLLTSYLFLHDNSLSPPNTSVLEAMKATYGSNKCFMLSINSQIDSTNVSENSDLWSSYISRCINYKDDGKDSIESVIVETAKEAGEISPSSPVIAHPLSPLVDSSSGVLPTIENDVTPVHGKLLNKEDLERIQLFINEFCTKALIPHFENQIHHLSDQISNKKGVSRSLFSATKRWFGTSKPGTAPSNHISPTAIAYSNDAHELQLRRLGDLCFMIGHYTLAFNAYHSAKRDFGADGAWLHYAGALEMAALSAFMTNSETFTRKVIEYSEESIVTYLNSCKMNQFATRATLLSAECLKSLGLYGEAAKQLIRMSGEDSDLRSAVLLEQAAYCFLQSPRPIMYRKYAFHMVLAGHRFSKASHKYHSVRCYYQSYQIYGNKSWSVAEDHILYTIGKHASYLKLSSQAVEALKLLVTRSSRQSPQQQEIYLKDYIATIQQQQESSSLEKVSLSLPLIDSNLTLVLLNVANRKMSPDKIPASGINYGLGFPNSSSSILSENEITEESIWWNLEEKLVNFSQNVNNTLLFRPTIELLSHLTDNSTSSFGFIDEPIGILIYIKNPLNIQINIKNIYLTWIMYPNGLVENKDTSNKYIHSEPLKEINLSSDSSKQILLQLKSNCIGELHITGLNYTLIDPLSDTSVEGSQKLFIHKNNKIDKRLHLNIIDSVPTLEIYFSGLKKELISGEILQIKVYCKNIGRIPINKILVTSSENFIILLKDNNNIKKEDDNNNSDNLLFNILLNKILGVGEVQEIVLLLQSQFKGKIKNLDLLFYYEGVPPSVSSESENYIKPKYRLIRHSWPTMVYDSVNIKTSCIKSHSFHISNEGINIPFEITTNTFESSSIRNLQIESISLISQNNIWKLAKMLNIVNNMNIPKGETLFILLQAIKSNKEIIQNNYLKFTIGNEGFYTDNFIPKFITNKNINNSLNIIIVIRWSTDIISSEEGFRKAFGQEYIFLSKIDDKNDTLSPTELKIFNESNFLLNNKNTSKDQHLINYIFKYPQKTLYNFQINKLCIIPINICLNNLLNEKIDLKIEAVPLPSLASLEDSTISEHFAWIGQTIFFRVIEPNSNLSITLLAGLTSTGTFDLSSRFKVFIKKNNEFIQQSCKPNSIIVIDSEISPKLFDL